MNCIMNSLSDAVCHKLVNQLPVMQLLLHWFKSLTSSLLSKDLAGHCCNKCLACLACNNVRLTLLQCLSAYACSSLKVLIHIPSESSTVSTYYLKILSSSSKGALL